MLAAQHPSEKADGGMTKASEDLYSSQWLGLPRGGASGSNRRPVTNSDARQGGYLARACFMDQTLLTSLQRPCSQHQS